MSTKRPTQTLNKSGMQVLAGSDLALQAHACQCRIREVSAAPKQDCVISCKSVSSFSHIL